MLVFALDQLTQAVEVAIVDRQRLEQTEHGLHHLLGRGSLRRLRFGFAHRRRSRPTWSAGGPIPFTGLQRTLATVASSASSRAGRRRPALTWSSSHAAAAIPASVGAYGALHCFPEVGARPTGHLPPGHRLHCTLSFP